MNKIFCILTLCLFYGSCNLSSRIVGNGINETRTETLPEFTGISHNLSHNLTIKQGEQHEISINGHSNVLNSVSHEIKNGVLYIDLVSGSYVNIYLDVEVTLQSLEFLELTSSGTINMEERDRVAESFRLITDGSGNINIQPQTGLKSINVTVDGNGDITFNGETKVSNTRIATDDSGNLFAYSLITDKCEILTDDDGVIQITVLDEMNCTIEDSGNIYYKGNPRIQLNKKGSGELINKNY